MSEEVHNDAQPENKSQPKPELDVNEVMARLEKMESTNNRLLEESKTWKNKYQTLNSEVEIQRKTELEKTENWKELLEIEKNKRSDYEVQLRDTKKSVLQKELNFKVASVAKDAFDVGDVIQSLPKDLIAIDEETLSVSGVDEAVNYVRESKPYLFQKEVKSGMSSARPEATTGKLTYDEMDDVAKDSLFKDALSQFV